MLEYLELDASPDTSGQVLAHGSEQVLSLPGSGYEAAEVRAHRTVADPRATIGRWRAGERRRLPGAGAGGLRRSAREFGYRTRSVGRSGDSESVGRARRSPRSSSPQPWRCGAADDPGDAVLALNAVPVAIIAFESGLEGGLIAAAVAFETVVLWAQTRS